MNNRKAEPKPIVDTINHVAERARAVRTSFQWMMWTSLPSMVIVLTTTLVKALIQVFTGRLIDDTPALFAAGVMLIPLLPCAVWMIVAQERLLSACRELRGLFVPEGSDIRQTLPPATLGPMLEATLIGAFTGGDVKPAAALLGAQLKSIRAEDGMVINDEQRKLLHELVLQGNRTWTRGYAKPIGQAMAHTIRQQVQPAAIHALGLLGNLGSIPVLQRFARTTTNGELQQSALDAVDRIQERIQYGPEQMLRASRAPERAEVLLRPTLPVNDTQKEELLRAQQSREN